MSKHLIGILKANRRSLTFAATKGCGHKSAMQNWTPLHIHIFVRRLNAYLKNIIFCAFLREKFGRNLALMVHMWTLCCWKFLATIPTKCPPKFRSWVGLQTFSLHETYMRNNQHVRRDLDLGPPGFRNSSSRARSVYKP